LPGDPLLNFELLKLFGPLLEILLVGIVLRSWLCLDLLFQHQALLAQSDHYLLSGRMDFVDIALMDIILDYL